MLSAFVSVAVMCAGCAIDEVSAVGARPWEVQAPLIDQQVLDGCARFALKVVNGVATVEALYNTNGCQTDAIKLEADSSPVFDSTTGVLRVPVVMRNLGTSPVVAPARIRFNADSSQFINAQGQVIAGTPNIVATNYDTANVSGRSGQWRYDTLLASSGQAQLLMPNAVSRRRWLEFSGSDWSQRIRIKLPTMATVAGTVPASPPDSAPAGFYDDSNFVVVAGLSSDPVIRDAVAVFFKPGTSQEERSSAIAQIGGVVVGGRRIGNTNDGYYLVRLPVDSTHANIAAAIASLLSTSKVSTAMYIQVLDNPGAYRKPNDGLAWLKLDYTARIEDGYLPTPTKSTWALEAIDAPMAWGCSIGDDSLRVSVIDIGLHVAGMVDLQANLGDTINVDRAGNAEQHGTGVAMVLSARADNSSQLAGVTWHSRLSLHDVTLYSSGMPVLDAQGHTRASVPDVVMEIQRAVQNRARIINISLGQATSATGIAPLARLLQNQAFALQVDSAVAAFRQAQSDLPLFVIAAGNNTGADPTYAFFPVVASTQPTRTLVVTASTRTDGGSLHSPPAASLVPASIAAPGQSVSAWNQLGEILASGTSFSTPMVSGAAALLMSFDPRLPSDSVRSILLAGAARGGRLAGGVPVLDAYEALKIAAQRPSAPLCGNRVWASNRAIQVERGSTVETLPVTLPSDSVWNVEVAHGGKQINYMTPNIYGMATVGSVVWTPSGWVAGPSTEIPTEDRGGSNRSVQLESHGGDSLLRVIVAQSTSAVDVNLTLLSDAGLTPLRSTTISLPGLAPPPTTDAGPNEWVFVSGAYPQNGGDALLAVNRIVATNSTGVTQCPNGPSVTCQPGAIFYRYYWRPKQTDLYRVNVSSAPMTATHIATIPDTLVYDIAYSEDGREKLLRMGRDSIYNGGDGVYENHTLMCNQSWSKPSFGSTSTTLAFDSTHARRVVSVFGCSSESRTELRYGVGTSAPRLGPQRRVGAKSG